MNELVIKGIVKAIRDLKTAQMLYELSKNTLYTDTICFNSQQASEKLLKSYLIDKNISFPRTHNLKFLHKLCIDSDIDFEKVSVNRLTAYAVEIRYPESFHIPALDEAKEALETALLIKEFVLKKLNMKETDLTLF